METLLYSAYGHVSALYTDLLSDKEIQLLSSVDSDHFLQVLSSTGYKQEISRFYNFYKLPALIDVVVTSHFINNCNKMLLILPLFSKQIIINYLKKIDIQNIKLIIAAKMMNKQFDFVEGNLIIDRLSFNLSSPLMSMGDYMNLINQKNIDEIVNYITRYGYSPLLSKERNFHSLSKRLDDQYFLRMVDSIKFFDGTEGPIIRFIRSLLDVRNIMYVMKAIETGSSINVDDMVGGNLDIEKLVNSESISDLLKKIPFKLDSAFERYKSDGLLSNFENSMKSQLNNYYLSVFRQHVNSVGFLLSYILSAEIERDKLRTMWFNKYYKLNKEEINNLIYGV